MAFYAKYGFLTISASIARLSFYLSGSTPDPKPDRVIDIPSRDKNRTIKTNVYDSADKSPGPSAVVVNFHGSGWISPCHGESDHYCRTIAQSTVYTVLDASYRLAPRTPFPGAQDDGEDVIRYVLANPHLYDSSRIVISGFSAGGHTALVLASTIFPAKTFSKMILFYIPVDLYTDTALLGQPDPNIIPLITPKSLNFMLACYLQDESLDRKDPRISPMYAPLDTLPEQILVFTAGADSVMPQTERFVELLRAESQQRQITYRKFENCGHAFDMCPKPGSVEEKAQREAYSMVVAMLQT